MTLETIILAAGKGTRMKSAMPKVLHKVGGKPMLQHVIDAVKKAGSSREVVVIGSGAELVMQTISGVEFVLQEEQLGTGHAVLSAEKNFEQSEGTVLILCGDTPLLTGELLQRVKDSTPIIDLATHPGGVDSAAAKGKNVIWALGLPGKVAPVTAGEYISKTVIGILEEEKLI